ncbi:hypothetical protein MITS9509_00845 [Synechococcus sp. MIT S9509]|uniref:DUF3153 domain-containing protein n=1 Tax=unclassified Synechococcus TaxID=2626047 RepID=UPI0007BC5727|nr:MULTISPECIES: DUF3153 domain-containing protein [unclassified Synechococcus]KZR86902.1 hypothetical protein MITS9504_00988 [Synechococcus sp. MIT S9504]KZR92972.1 hypothetical protein MITS9509_00845 [Synechococcus sp. MIT S9509]
MSTGLAAAERALERGDYGLCLRLLEPLADANPITEPEGAAIRMVMVTAWMGQGEERKAISTCRLLTRCKDPDLRNRARQLLSVLEAPSLERPARWSMQLPTLDMAPRVGKGTLTSRRRRGPPPPPPPPTGPTQAPSAGFAVLVLAVLIGLTLLLSGCVRVTAELDLAGPDRLAMSWRINSLSGHSLPWQQNFAKALRSEGLNWRVHQDRTGSLNLISPTLGAGQAATLMRSSVELAGRSAGVTLPTPDLAIVERNWLVGMQQQLNLRLDLSPLAEFPAGDLQISITPIQDLQQVSSSPMKGRLEGDVLLWTLDSGSVNQLQIQRWQWSPLGLGSVLIVLLLLLSFLLQSMRVRLGFGYPQLPS